MFAQSRSMFIWVEHSCLNPNYYLATFSWLLAILLRAGRRRASISLMVGDKVTMGLVSSGAGVLALVLLKAISLPIVFSKGIVFFWKHPLTKLVSRKSLCSFCGSSRFERISQAFHFLKISPRVWPGETWSGYPVFFGLPWNRVNTLGTGSKQGKTG